MAQCYGDGYRDTLEPDFFDFVMLRCRIWPQTWLPRRISEVKRLLRRRVLKRHLSVGLRLALGRIFDADTRRIIAAFLVPALRIRKAI